tara:strand:+ start:2433 stop:3161 length:729 start_codon:yes stop_codon:yes gene_type:complete
MSKYLLVIADYPAPKQEIFDNQISPRNKEFAEQHGYEYIVSKGGPFVRNSGHWRCFTLPNTMINDGTLKEGDTLLSFDADMVVSKIEQDYPNEKTFAYAIDNGNTHCMGNFSLKINKWSIGLINNLLSNELFSKMQNDSHWQVFGEQAAWYTLAGIVTHSWTPFFDLENYGWHSNVTENMKYSIDELNEHVHVLGPEWNTTLLEGDPISKQLQQYNITKSKKEDTIIRHFAGGQPWEVERWL